MTPKLTTPNPELDPDTDTADTDDESRTDLPTRTERTDRPTGRGLPTFGLTATQLTGTALAAITATVAASYLGVTGTVVGAALASVLTAVGNAVYTASLRTTRDRVREVVPARVTRSLPVGRVEDVPPTLPGSRPRPRRPSPHPTGTAVWKRAVLGAVGLFVVLMAVVTGVEVVAGRPISDVVRGDSGGGTSFFGHNTVSTRTVPPIAPTVYVTVTPKVVVTTPTVTQTAPATTTTPAPSVTGSASGSATAPGTPTAQPTSASTGTP